jgi:hypothetical protein
MLKIFTLVLASISMGILGCSGLPGRIAAPAVDADDAAQQALTLYDGNNDGQLNDEELKASPPLLNAKSAYDTNGDGFLSRKELVAGIGSWTGRNVGALALPIAVSLDGKPLQGAKVKLIPAPFLSEAIIPASGVTDESGLGSVGIASENLPANFPANLPVIQPGLYLVEITHPTILIPDAYNKATTLGLEAGLADQNPSGVVWELSSKKN